MKLDDFLNIFRRKEQQTALPFWAYRLECPVCKMSFMSAERHYKYAVGKIERKHWECAK